MTAVSYFISRIKRNHGSWNIELCVTLRAMAVHVLQGVELTAVHNNTEGAIFFFFFFLTILNLQRERHRIIKSLWTSGWTFIVLCCEYAESDWQNLLNEIQFEISMYHWCNSDSNLRKFWN